MMNFQTVLEQARKRDVYSHIMALRTGCCIGAMHEGGMIGYHIPCGDVVLPMYLCGPSSLWRWIDKIEFVQVNANTLTVTDTQGFKVVLPELILKRHYSGPEVTLAEGLMDKEVCAQAIGTVADRHGNVQDGKLWVKDTPVGYSTYRRPGHCEFFWPNKIPLLLDALDGRFLFWRLEQLESHNGLLELMYGSLWVGINVDLLQ